MGTRLSGSPFLRVLTCGSVNVVGAGDGLGIVAVEHVDGSALLLVVNQVVQRAEDTVLVSVLDDVLIDSVDVLLGVALNGSGQLELGNQIVVTQEAVAHKRIDVRILILLILGVNSAGPKRAAHPVEVEVPLRRILLSGVDDTVVQQLQLSLNADGLKQNLNGLGGVFNDLVASLMFVTTRTIMLIIK